MDVKIINTKPRWHKPLLVICALAGLVLLGTLWASPGHQHKIDRSRLMLAQVQRGDLQIGVDAYGVLRSDKQTLLTALTSATVQQVLLRPGAQVTADSVILKLSNPELLQDVEAAAMALAQEEANLKRLKLANQREQLAEQALQAELDANLQMVTLRRNAEQQLVADGVVSSLTYQTTVLQQQQMQQRLDLQQQRLQQLGEVITQSEIIQQEQINQARANYLSMQQRAERLTLRAGMAGVLQRLPVELGQSVASGQELALIGSDQDLQALVRVSQSSAEQLQIGQKAQINTRRERVTAVVTRITPEVREGTIEVELAFTDAVPASARPELSIDAQIFTAQLSDTLYLERPVNTQSHSSSRLFKLSTDGKVLSATDLQFGDDAGRYLQITSGAQQGDTFVLSDMAMYRDAELIHLQ